MDIGLAGSLLVAFGLLVLLAVVLAPLVEKLILRMGESQDHRIDQPRVKKLIEYQQLLSRRESHLTKTADLEIEDLIHAGKLDNALALARERMREMHLQGRVEPEALYRSYIDDLSARIERDAGPSR